MENNNNQEVGVVKNTKNKKPIHKRWWFWTIIVILLFSMIGNCGSDGEDATKDSVEAVAQQSDNTEKANEETKAVEVEEPAKTAEPEETEEQQESEQEEVAFPFDVVYQGMYKVGSEIPAGEYMIIRDVNDYGAYIAVTKDSSGELDSIVTNESVDSFHIVTISDGQYFEISGGMAVLFDEFVAEYPGIGIAEDGSYLPGMYKVGVTLDSGEYKLTADPDEYGGYVQVSKNSIGDLDSIKTNDSFDSSKYVTVSDGDYLIVHGATFEKVD